MDSLTEIEFLILLLGAVVLLAQLARVARVPYPIFLVLGGLAIGFVPEIPEISLPPEVIFLVFLPPLLNSAAFSSSPLDLRAHIRPILLLAIGLVLLTISLVAIAAHFVIGLPWAAAFVLGAVVAPTDPVAAEAIFRRLGVPDRVSTVIGGESLINDGSALVAFRLAVGAVVGGTFSIWQAGLSFLLVGGGGLLLGLVLARVFTPLWGRITDPSILIVVSVVMPYATYVLAEELHASGILAVVAFGLYQGWHSPTLFPGASARLQALGFWGVLTFLLDSLLFILVGLQFPAIFEGAQDQTVGELLSYAALVCGVVIVTRMLWFFSIPYAHPIFNRIVRINYLRAPWRERVVMGWSGLRGAVSLAAALAIPLTVPGGGDFPQRDLIIFLAFCTILATLVLQGLTLPPLIRTLDLRADEAALTMAELRARVKASRAALSRLEELSEDDRFSDNNHEQMREYYENRIERYNSGLEAEGTTEEYAASSSSWRDWRRSLLSAEREELLSLRNNGDISPEVMRRIERDLDLEESRIGG
jgi:CPA1 family monovalent cation:H+ antiporter